MVRLFVPQWAEPDNRNIEAVGLGTFIEFSRRYIWKYIWWYLGGFACIFLTQLLAVGIIEETKQGIDAAIASGATAATIMPFVWAIVAYAVLIVIIRTSSRLLIFTPGRLSEFHIRNDFFSRLLFLQRDFYRDHESGDLVSRCSNDIGFIRAAYGFGLLQVANVTVTLALGMAAMLRMDLKTTVLVAVPMVISFAIIQGSIHYLFNYWRDSNEQLGGMSALCLASFKGVSAIQNYHAEPAVISRFGKLNQQYLDTQIVITRNRSFVIPLVQLVGNLSVFFVLFTVGPKVIAGRLTMGEIMAFLGYIAMVMPPLLSMGWMLNVFNRAVPAMDRLNEILQAKPNILPPVAGSEKALAGPVTLEAKGLTFRFPEIERDLQRFAIEGVRIDLPPGKVLGLVGPLGSGKTTLLETMLRLNELAPGQLYLNGADAAHLPLAKFREVFSFAPQRAWLFSTTLRRNLQIALPAEEWEKPGLDARLVDAMTVAGFQLDPKQFPEGLDTQVGEDGVMLSGGQRQRIALARALLKDAEIFVLDDVLSAVDHDTEKTILANLREFIAGKSLIIASHRVSALQWADEILVMDDGRIVDRGSHEKLSRREGFYRNIYIHQSQNPDGESWPQ